MFTVASCGILGEEGRSFGTVGTASLDPATKSAVTITGKPSAELQERYRLTIPTGAADSSYGYHREGGGGGELWVSFKIDGEGLGAFLSSLGVSEEDLSPGFVAFTSSDLDLTGWSIDDSHSVKGKMIGTKNDDLKAPGARVTIDYSDPGAVTVYALSVKP
ncbi:hypothetical protein [Kitasatospora purpeofusca]|uniref:hypothetical protein n=1 Tax=Kitasatospora purpeofusca TaxID=67352 RepID=UPI003664059E